MERLVFFNVKLKSSCCGAEGRYLRRVDDSLGEGCRSQCASIDLVAMSQQMDYTCIEGGMAEEPLKLSNVEAELALAFCIVCDK